jgi:hypothetical protein
MRCVTTALTRVYKHCISPSVLLLAPGSLLGRRMLVPALSRSLRHPLIMDHQLLCAVGDVREGGLGLVLVGEGSVGDRSGLDVTKARTEVMSGS